VPAPRETSPVRAQGRVGYTCHDIGIDTRSRVYRRLLPRFGMPSLEVSGATDPKARLIRISFTPRALPMHGDVRPIRAPLTPPLIK